MTKKHLDKIIFRLYHAEHTGYSSHQGMETIILQSLHGWNMSEIGGLRSASQLKDMV